MSRKNNREDLEMKRKIKEMENQARVDAMASASFTVVETENKEEQMSYDQWWMMAQGRQKMRPHLKEVIWADMKARGLSKKETKNKYDEALRLFGYSW